MNKKPAIHQLVAGYALNDAISNEARVIREILQGWGHASDIFCEPQRTATTLQRETRASTQIENLLHPEDVAILHLSIGSNINELFSRLTCRRAIIYHNITPADYFRGINEAIAADLAHGRKQVAALANAAQVVMADSHFNAEELQAVGYPPATVLPLVLDFNRIRTTPDRAITRRYQDGLKNIIFVGRCAPNKRIEDLLHAFHYYQRHVRPESRLIIAGSAAGLEKYQMYLHARAQELALQEVIFTGMVTQAELSAIYGCAHLFLCMSEHEGFCIPLIESMVHNVPVLAYAAAAVPETLAGAGVLFTEKRWDLIAEMMEHLIEDANLRTAVLAQQRERIKQYEQQDLSAILKNSLTPLLADS